MVIGEGALKEKVISSGVASSAGVRSLASNWHNVDILHASMLLVLRMNHL